MPPRNLLEPGNRDWQSVLPLHDRQLCARVRSHHVHAVLCRDHYAGVVFLGMRWDFHPRYSSKSICCTYTHDHRDPIILMLFLSTVSVGGDSGLGCLEEDEGSECESPEYISTCWVMVDALMILLVLISCRLGFETPWDCGGRTPSGEVMVLIGTLLMVSACVFKCVVFRHRAMERRNSREQGC